MLSPDAIDAVGGADDTVMIRHTKAASPCPEAVDDQVTRPAELVPEIRLGLEHRHSRGLTRDDSSRG
jgi:hypothetical protein